MSHLDTLPKTHVLANGLTVLLAPMQSRSVTVLAMVGTGSRYESEKTSGISHFLEHMVFKGTAEFPTAKSLAEAVDSVGASFNAFTSKEYTGYYVKSASEHVDLGLHVVSDMLLTPTLGKPEIEREKGVIIEEIHMYEDNPARHVGDVFERMMFHGSPLGRDIIGTPETVQSCTQETFQEHLRQWYGLANVVLTIAGDDSVVNDRLIHKISTYFSKPHAQRESRSPEKTIARITGNPLSHTSHLHVEYKDTQQAHFIMAHEGLRRRDPDNYAASVLATLLGGNMSSRLFTEVREKRGLCYYVHSDDDSYHDVGIFGASAGVDPKRVVEAVQVIREQFSHLVDETGAHAITEEEVYKAKNHAIGSSVLHLEDSMSIAQFYAARKLLRNEIITPEEELSRIKNVSFEDVVRVAKRILGSSSMYFSIVGPYKNASTFEELLKNG